MAYASSGLSALGYSNGFTLWQYRSTDTLNTIMAAGYFNSAANMLRVGDEIMIEGSNALWRDRVWRINGSTVQIGVDPSVTDPAGPEGHRLGEILERWDNTVWEYFQAAGTIAAFDVVIAHDDHSATAITTTLAAAGTGQGKRCAVAHHSPSAPITFGKYFWGCIFAPAHGQQKVNVLISCVKYTNLYTTATAGKLDDAPTTLVRGMALVATEPGVGTAAIGAVINSPYVA
jgi:hypothetical protein